MKRDPIVEEIHQTRQKLLEECGGDLNQLMDRLKAAEIQDRSRVVSILKGGIIRIVGILQLLTTRRWPTKSNINHRLEIQALNTPP